MKVLSLFSGGGLGDFGLELAGMKIVCQVEIDEYCQKILALRWPEVPKFKDIKTFDGKPWRGAVDLVAGGFPCQPFSVAGRRKGAADERNLWPEMFRIICEVRPRWILAENVPGLLSMESGRIFGGILRDLSKSGYCAEWDCIPAAAVGAPHRRDRVWIVGHAERGRRCGKPRGRTGTVLEDRYFQLEKETMANPKSTVRVRLVTEPDRQQDRPSDRGWWAVEPEVGRVAHGVPSRVDRLKLLGNGQVVQVVEWIGKRIMEFDRTFNQ